jgi:hypothetical protein
VLSQAETQAEEKLRGAKRRHSAHLNQFERVCHPGAGGGARPRARDGTFDGPRQYTAENCFYVILFHISDSNKSPAFCTVLRGLPVIIQAANDLTAQAGNQASTTPANDDVHLPNLEITSVQFLKV